MSGTNYVEVSEFHDTGNVKPFAAEHIKIDIYSYVDEIEQPLVKLNITKDDNTVIVPVDVQKSTPVNKSTSSLTIPKIIAEKNMGTLRFNEYFNKVPGEGAKTKMQSITGSQSTVANAIAELIKARTDNNKSTMDPFILFLRGQEQGKILRLVPEFDGKVTYDYYSQLVGKQATSDQITEKNNLIFAELEIIKQKVNSESTAKSMATQGAAQELALEALKASVDKFILKDKSGALSQKNFDNYIKNIKGLSNKINPDTGLLTGKKLLGSGFDPKKIMGQVDIEKAVLTLPLFGGKTCKNKKSKTQKGGRKHNKSKKH